VKARIVALLVASLLEIIFIAKYLFSSSYLIGQTSQALCIVTWASLGGFFFLRGTKMDTLLNKFERISLYVVLGIIFSVISDQILLNSLLGKIAWLLPTALITLGSLIFKGFGTQYKTRISFVNKSSNFFANWTSIVVIFGSFLLLYAPWINANPLDWKGNWKFHVDVSFMESISNSFAIKGFSHSYIDADWDVKYHWFIYSFVGLLNKVGDFQPFFILTRFLPILMVVTLFPISVGLMSRIRGKIQFSLIDKLVPIFFLVGPGFAAGSYLQLRSPNSPFGITWILIVAILFSVLMCERTINLHQYALLVLVASTSVLVRASNMPLILIGLLAIWLSSSKVVRSGGYQRALFLISIFSVLFTYFAFIHGPARPLTFKPYLGIMGFSLPILIASAGIMLFRSTSQFSLSIKRFSIAVLVLGQTLSFFLYDISGNQTYFLHTAGALALPVSVAGYMQWLGRRNTFFDRGKVALRSTDSRLKLLGWAFAVSSSVATAIIWNLIESRTTAASKVYRQVLPVIYSVIIGFTIYRLRFYLNRKKKYIESWKFIVLTSMFLTPFLSLSIQVATGPQYSRSENYAFFGSTTSPQKGGVPYGYVRAGRWVQEHVPSGAKFFTNRQCLSSLATKYNCIGLWTYASAFSKRDFIIESYWHSGATFPHSERMIKLQELSSNYSGMNSSQKKSFIDEFKLEWGWIDLSVDPRFEVSENEMEFYRNDKVVIIKLVSE